MSKPKISWNAAHAVAAYCREHNITYSNEATYPNPFVAGTKKNLRTTNGMLYHLPRTTASPWIKETEARVYLCWFGEPMEQVIESLAFLRMTTPRQLWVLRCKGGVRTRDGGEFNGATTKANNLSQDASPHEGGEDEASGSA